MSTELFRKGRETITFEGVLIAAKEFRSWTKDENTGVSSQNPVAPGKEAFEVSILINGEDKPVKPVVLKSAFKNGIVPSIGLNPIPCRIEAVQVKYFSKQQQKEVEGMNVVSVTYNDEDLSDKSLKIMLAQGQATFQL